MKQYLMLITWGSRSGGTSMSVEKYPTRAEVDARRAELWKSSEHTAYGVVEIIIFKAKVIE